MTGQPLPEHDRIEWTNPIRNERGRFELHFKNLTRAEAAQLLMCLDRMQTDRKTALYVGDKLTIDQASAPETAGRDFAREHGIKDHSLQADAARELTRDHGADITGTAIASEAPDELST